MCGDWGRVGFIGWVRGGRQVVELKEVGAWVPAAAFVQHSGRGALLGIR